MTAHQEVPRVATRVEDLKWLQAVVAKSERILDEVPQEDRSSWYAIYETAGDRR